MRIDRVKVTTHFDEFGVLKDTWIGLEAVIDDNETAESMLSALKEIEEQWYAKQNPHLHPQAPPIHYTPPIYYNDREPGLTVEEIKSCNELVVIDSYRLIVNTPGNEKLKEAWTIRREEIVAKESKEILEATERELMRRRTNNLDK